MQSIRLSSWITRSIAVSSADLPRIAATWARVLPVRYLSESCLKPMSRTPCGPPAPENPWPGCRISAITRRRTAGSFIRLCPLPQSALPHPGRHRRVEAGGAGGIGVHVGGDAEPLGLRRGDQRDQAVQLAPVGPAGRLEMVDLGRRAAPARDGDQLGDRLEQAVVLIPDVGDVHPARLVGRRGQGHELVGRGIEGGLVDQRGTDAEGALLHGLAHETLHLRQLGGIRRPVGVAEDVFAHRRRARRTTRHWAKCPATPGSRGIRPGCSTGCRT